jgi:hypothetical protein
MSKHLSGWGAGALLARWEQLSAQVPNGSGSAIRIKADVLERVRASHHQDLLWLAKRHRVSFSTGLDGAGPGADVPLQQCAQMPISGLRLTDLIEAPKDQELLQRLSQFLRERVTN